MWPGRPQWDAPWDPIVTLESERADQSPRCRASAFRAIPTLVPIPMKSSSVLPSYRPADTIRATGKPLMPHSRLTPAAMSSFPVAHRERGSTLNRSHVSPIEMRFSIPR